MKEYMVERADGKKVLISAESFGVNKDQVLRFFKRDEESDCEFVRLATFHPHRWIYVREVCTGEMDKECDCGEETSLLHASAARVYIETIVDGRVADFAMKMAEGLSQEKG